MNHEEDEEKSSEKKKLKARELEWIGLHCAYECIYFLGIKRATSFLILRKKEEGFRNM